MGTALLIIAIIVLGIILWRFLKPYFIRYDTTILFTGGLGSGKTLESVKTAIILLRKIRLIKYTIYNAWWKFWNKLIKAHNKKVIKYNLKLQLKYKNNLPANVNYKKPWKERKLRQKPMLYSNIPVCFKPHFWSKKREWSKQLKASHLLLLEEIREYSIVLIDELPQFVNQFNWSEDLIQKNVNEFITFFRHYIAGYFICNAQAVDDVVVQIRRKLNQAIWCFEFKKWFFGLFYTNRMCDIMLSDQVSTISTTFIEENTRLHFGLFPPKNTYDTRCYSPRYNNILKPYEKGNRHTAIKTTKVLRLQKYTSPLDDTTTAEQKQDMWNKGEKIWQN